MPKKKEKIIEEESIVEEGIAKLDVNFGRSDLQAIADKINEIIEAIK